MSRKINTIMDINEGYRRIVKVVSDITLSVEHHGHTLVVLSDDTTITVPHTITNLSEPFECGIYAKALNVAVVPEDAFVEIESAGQVGSFVIEENSWTAISVGLIDDITGIQEYWLVSGEFGGGPLPPPGILGLNGGTPLMLNGGTPLELNGA